jgi:hypothetical protein
MEGGIPPRPCLTHGRGILPQNLMKRKNILLAMVEATLFQMNPKTEWLGDYPKMADKIKRQKTN